MTSAAARRTIGAVLLAAGSGSRMGLRPKSLLELDGMPLIARQLGALADAGVDEVVVVLGHHAARIEPVVRRFPVTLVHNPDPDAGPVSSQRIGLAALGGGHAAVLIALADQPSILAGDVLALLDAWWARPEGAAVVFPRVDGERGNPVVVGAEVREQVLAAPPKVGCRQWQDAHPEAVAPFETGNVHYRIDLDSPEDVARFERETGQALRWPAGLGG